TWLAGGGSHIVHLFEAAGREAATVFGNRSPLARADGVALSRVGLEDVQVGHVDGADGAVEDGTAAAAGAVFLELRGRRTRLGDVLAEGPPAAGAQVLVLALFRQHEVTVHRHHLGVANRVVLVGDLGRLIAGLHAGQIAVRDLAV